VDILVGNNDQQLSFVKIKARTAKKLGVKFDFYHIKKIPSFQEFMIKIKQKTANINNRGIIIQQPLPSQLNTNSLYEYIPLYQEIEGHRKKTPFLPPLGLAVLTVIKNIFLGTSDIKKLLIDIKKDRLLFKKILRNKKIVIVGRGITGGSPIAKTLTEMKINYLSLNSTTPEPETYLKEADIIITAVGKKIITPDKIKPGVILINVGLRKENGTLKGDYNEKEIKHLASYYTVTPGGVGPIDVLYLYYNLLLSAKMSPIPC
jgi:methylenetetrahydrofolate dehydrogenase (NADP+)/methenyltetrahydrofolate cyclohydrolase